MGCRLLQNPLTFSYKIAGGVLLVGFPSSASKISNLVIARAQKFSASVRSRAAVSNAARSRVASSQRVLPTPSSPVNEPTVEYTRDQVRSLILRPQCIDTVLQEDDYELDTLKQLVRDADDPMYAACIEQHVNISRGGESY